MLASASAPCLRMPIKDNVLTWDPVLTLFVIRIRQVMELRLTTPTHSF